MSSIFSLHCCLQVSPSTTTATNSAAYATPSTGSSEGAKRRGKSPGQKKKGSKRASSALGTPRRKTQNPIEDDLIFRIGETFVINRLVQINQQILVFFLLQLLKLKTLFKRWQNFSWGRILKLGYGFTAGCYIDNFCLENIWMCITPIACQLMAFWSSPTENNNNMKRPKDGKKGVKMEQFKRDGT